jgi:prepilin-type processing-associated H-X9-DG protein
LRVKPLIAPDVFILRPDFTALSIQVSGCCNGPSNEVSAALLAEARTSLATAAWADGHVEAWREAYRAFGAKPKRTPCSAEALRKRMEKDGALPAVNAVVDIYNAVSVIYAVPVGGEDLGAYQGQPRLERANGNEKFDTIANGLPAIETVDPGEVVWRDSNGVTCRRWNWRQGVRTRITEATTDIWFVIEGLDPMPVASLLQAGERLVSELQKLSPGLEASSSLLARPGVF